MIDEQSPIHTFVPSSANEEDLQFLRYGRDTPTNSDPKMRRRTNVLSDYLVRPGKRSDDDIMKRRFKDIWTRQVMDAYRRKRASFDGSMYNREARDIYNRLMRKRLSELVLRPVMLEGNQF